MRKDLPRLDDLPIPETVQPDQGWSPLMHDMAAHIGPYRTLLLLDRHGGRQVYVPQDADRCPFADVVPDAAGTIARIYGGTRIDLPAARAPLRKARRAGVIAAVRAKRLTAADAQIICRTSRRYIQQLVHETDEGLAGATYTPPPRPVDPRQMDMFDD